MSRSQSCVYFSIRKNSGAKRSIVQMLHPREQKLSIDYFLGTAKIQMVREKKTFKDTLKNMMTSIS